MIGRLSHALGYALRLAFGPSVLRGDGNPRQMAAIQTLRLGSMQERSAKDALYPHCRSIDVAPVEAPICRCGGSGVVLVTGPCDAAPLEAPCICMAGTVR